MQEGRCLVLNEGRVWHSLDGRTRTGLVVLGSVVVGVSAFFGYRHLGSAAGGGRIAAGDFAVHVAGAVREPQVISANDKMLVAEAIERAGGPTADADLDQLNLAAKLVPNSQLYVPRKGEDVLERLGPYSVSLQSSSETATRSIGVSETININTADEAELDKLPGVGPATAKKIIEYRQQTGGFKSVEELVNVKGIGSKKLEQMRPYITVN